MKKWLVLVWFCFVIRGLFYCSVLPLWEGFDEWGHFGVIEQMRLSGSPVIDRNSLVTAEIDASFLLAPMPRGMTNMPDKAVSHKEYWLKPSTERDNEQRHLRELSADLAKVPSSKGMPAYEASQPPLYYVFLTLILNPFGDSSLLTRVWIARYTSVLIASLILPVAHQVFLRVWNDTRLALAGTAFIASAPAFVLNQARISNECLAGVIFTLLMWALVRAISDRTVRSAFLVGVVLGIGLLTKAYFLTAIPAAVVIYLLLFIRHPKERRQVVQHLTIALLVAIGIAGWWYVRNAIQTGTISGLDEALMLRNVSTADRFHGFINVNWIQAIATVVLSHIWYGGWSLLSLPHWMYYGPVLVIGIAAIGCVRSAVQRLHMQFMAFLAIYGFFWLGQFYQIGMMFESKGSSTAMGGWYLHAVVVAEIILFFFGLASIVPGRYVRWIPTTITIYLISIDLYSLHRISLPYFTQSSHFGESMTRLAQNKPLFLTSEVLACQWILFLLATLTLLAVIICTVQPTNFGSRPLPFRK